MKIQIGHILYFYKVKKKLKKLSKRLLSESNTRASLVAQMVKNMPAMQEARVWFLGGKDPLEKGIATHSSIFAWKILCTEEPGGLQSMGLQKVRHNWATNIFTFKVPTIPPIHLPKAISFLMMISPCYLFWNILPTSCSPLPLLAPHFAILFL